MKKKLFSRRELSKLCAEFSNSQVLVKDAIGKVIKITSLNEVFIERFIPGKGPKTFMVNDEYYRLLFYNSDNESIEQSTIYVEALNDNARKKHNKISDWLLLEEFLYEYWNPGGVYAIEGWLLQRS